MSFQRRHKKTNKTLRSIIKHVVKMHMANIFHRVIQKSNYKSEKEVCLYVKVNFTIFFVHLLIMITMGAPVIRG